MTKTVNGFKVEDIMGTVDAIKREPAIAAFQFRARNKWIKGGHNRSKIHDFYGGMQEDTSRLVAWELDNSEPPILLGENEGPNPVEYILHGLAGCMTTTMVLHAAAHGIAVDSVESCLKGHLDVRGFLDLDPSVRNGYQCITVEFTIKGDITEAQRKQLVEFTSMSPVFDIVTNKVPVSVSMKMA